MNIEIPRERIEEFCRKWKIAELALFGSVLGDEFRPDSDVDVLVPGNLATADARRGAIERLRTVAPGGSTNLSGGWLAGCEQVASALSESGVNRVLLLTDGRFSGGTTGLCVGHVAPEAVDGGPIAFIKDGDKIRLDVAKGTLDLLVDEDELQSRKAGFEPLPPVYTTGVLAKYTKLVGSAAVGAVCS